MVIEGLGALVPHDVIPDWLVSELIEVPYFCGKQMRFVFDGLKGDHSPDEYASAVRRFMGLTIHDRNAVANYVFKNYRQMREAVGDEQVGIEIAEPSDVWNHVQPQEVYVTRRFYGDRKVYVQITAECAWEPEHGLQIVYREGSELNRVSQQDGHLTHVDAYGLPEAEDRITE